MDNHPIENLMKSTMENIKDMIDVNTIVGDAVEAKDGTLIIPISKVSFGFASGGSEFDNRNTGGTGSSPYPFGGGSGAGVTVKPVAFLVTKQDSVRLLSLNQQNTYDKIIDSIPQVMDFIKNITKDKDTENHKKDSKEHSKEDSKKDSKETSEEKQTEKNSDE
ncbi:sporulation protein [Clostridium carboxidivorans P7]|uniref:GerW family sporulation protein n=1 Tax=Clostridium carboxidivorans TaxID=217159 RepID=UPI0001D393DD|nr:GerW family sporulation protein [Clostridium carboxidivorans]AKN34048.1 sporulation protein [Clostridium carboxidivorans P7]EFG88078.1 sporulation protein YtfJ [Clostridium carboxidivorans P7]